MADLQDFAFAAFYYPEMLAAVVALKTRDWPEHTETDPHDPVVQQLRLSCFLAHGGAVRLDHTARELYWPSLKLRSSAIAVAALQDYRLAAASPAVVDVLGDVGAVGAGDRLLHAHSMVSTGAERGAVRLEYEYLSNDALMAEAGRSTWPHLVVGDDDAGTVEALDDLADLSWALTAPDENGSRWVAFGNPDLMFDKIRIEATSGPGGELVCRWEYNDDLRELAPDAVTDNLDGTITLDVTTLVGNTYAPSTGALVTVTCLRTGIAEILATVNTGGAGGTEEITTASTLGQTSISEGVADYAVSAAWVELPDLVDGTVRDDPSHGTFDQAGDVTWSLPETVDRRWGRMGLEIDTGAHAGETLTGHYARVRFLSGDTNFTVTFDPIVEARATTWTLRFEATQGRRVVQALGTSDGTANQAFDLGSTPFLSLNQLTVGGVVWERVVNFLTAGPFDRVYKLLEQPDGVWRLTFGDGARGKVPPDGDAISADYRIGGFANGNVGPLAVSKDRTGNRLQAIRNPRAASGWVAAEGSTEASLEVVREAVPASVRAGTRAVTPEDAETLAVAYRTATGRQLAVRVLAVEEGAGPKTMVLYCVGAEGVAPTPADLAELETYFNGQRIGLQRIGGVGMANVAYTCAAFTAVPVAIVATVDVLDNYAAAAKGKIVAALGSVLQPTARRLLLNEDGVWEESAQYLWGWGSTVAHAALIARIVSATGGVVNLSLTTPAGDTALGDGELPVPGTIAITVVAVAS